MSDDPPPFGDNDTQAVIWQGAEHWIAFFKGKPLIPTFGTQPAAWKVVERLEKLSADEQAAFLEKAHIKIADEEKGLLHGSDLQRWKVFSIKEDCWLIVGPDGRVLETLQETIEAVETNLEALLIAEAGGSPPGP